LGTTFYMMGRRDEAMHEWEAVLAIEPEHKAAHLYVRMAREGTAGTSREAVPLAMPSSPSEATLNDILDGFETGGGGGGGESSST
jgi:hypothetical protein